MEIEFRAWYEEEKFMAVVTEIKWPSYIKPEGQVHIGYVGIGGHYYVPFSSVVLMQYSGAKDVNTEAKIYDGDIVLAEYHWNVPHVLTLPADYYDLFECGLFDCLAIEGNVFQSPHLVDKADIYNWLENK